MVENPYFDLYKGKEIRGSDLEIMSPITKPAVEGLLRDRKIVGQYTLDSDVIFWMPEKTSFSGVLPPRRFGPCPAPRWEKDWIESEKVHLGR